MIYFILALFVLMYVLIIILPDYKLYIAGSVAIISVLTVLIGNKASFIEVLTSIDYNVLLMLIGIMLTVGIFSESNMPNKIADKLITKIPNGMAILVLLSVLSGMVSAFIDNVATVLMLAPIGFAAAKKLKISPVPVILCISISSNLQGAATLVGDTTSIMLAGHAGLSFSDFFILDGKPSIFFAVEIGAIVTIPVLMFIFRKSNVKISMMPEQIKVKYVLPTVTLILNILALIAVSFIPNKFELLNGIICMFFGIVSFVFYLIKNKANFFKSLKDNVDFSTVLFLLSLFIVIFAVERVGIIAKISQFFVNVGGDNVFLLYTLIVFGSVILSMFIDNIPYVATMLPVISGIIEASGASNNVAILLYFGLLIGATLGGNLTPVGASANVVAIGMLKKQGESVSLKTFLKIGVPFTLLAVFCGYGFCYLIWA